MLVALVALVALSGVAAAVVVLFAAALVVIWVKVLVLVVFCGVFAVLVMEKSSRKSSQNVAATGSDGHPGDDCEGQSNDAFG